MDIEDKEIIEDLQSRLAFQEDTLASLNKQFAEQANEMTSLKSQMQLIYKKVDSIMFEFERSQGGEDQETPPHY